ncbi:type I-F CRISPR-associated protein Csy3 [Methylovulum psychrotolerans]|jgi:CRISPR-associated protein Csy3|uniref:Type I-F CRISPR-associated protein Csy3 n=1 Tax=Methylovulum psychrotolerans TaxID=1704499 RepID=A0A1Z4C455_9GAMM|nr:type I-F CRISPR-associated protein Csy3 [Methylovulum psychrotolerans]ASF48264.1 type I-F CRISPR-associated protein Csy3 [Methylovulum psychrotolerans]
MAIKNDATVLAFEKKLVPSDGYLYGTNWVERHQAKPTALSLIEKSVRGTISNRLKPAVQNDPLKLNAEVEKPNLQKIDACALGENQDTLRLNFTLKVLGGVEKPSASNGVAFNQSYPDVAKTYIAQDGFAELAKRYATNIANARYLWRNRVGAEQIEVIVNTGDGQPLTFNAKDFSLRNFDVTNPDLERLAAKISDALSGKTPYLLISIEAYALIGKAQEVYPSEELVLDKGKGSKSKILYQVNDVAALHSQKIGNALRTIDTWYPSFDEAQIGPIAIEPYGAVTNLGKAFRNPKEKADFYTLFDRFALGESLAEKGQEHYVMAVLVRGGVFGQSGKD